MSQSYIKSNRIPLTKGELILDVLNRECGTDSDTAEELFYKLNPLVTSVHIPATGDYLVPMLDSKGEATSETEGLLLWGL